MDINAAGNAYLAQLHADHAARQVQGMHELELTAGLYALYKWQQYQQEKAYAASPEGMAERIAREYGL